MGDLCLALGLLGIVLGFVIGVRRTRRVDHRIADEVAAACARLRGDA